MLQSIKRNPETLFLLSVLCYWVATSLLLNPVAIVLFVLALIMVFKPIKSLAVGVGIIYSIINAYMVLALLSEFNEFPGFNKQAFYLIAVGGGFLAFNFYVAIQMIIKNLPQEGKVGQMA